MMQARPKHAGFVMQTNKNNTLICSVKVHPLQHWEAMRSRDGKWECGYKGTWLYHMSNDEFNSQFVLLEEEQE